MTYRLPIVVSNLTVVAVMPLALSVPNATSADSDCGPATGMLTPANFATGSSVTECNAVGRSLSSGRLTAQIPPPGVSVTAEAMFEDGGEMLSIVVSADGDISYPDPDASQVATSTSSAPPAACDDDAYNDKDEEQAGTWEWYLGDGTRPAGMNTTQTANALRQAVGWIESSHNNCGMSDEVSANASYQGTSTYESDMTTADGKTSCGDGSIDGRDGKSVVDFGNLDKNGNPPLAMECTWSIPAPFADNNIIESDIRFNTTNSDFYYTKPTNCEGSYDLRGVAVHEFGHSFGMGHVSEESHGNLTMSTNLPDCNNSQRTLGKGDVLGLRNTY